nr:pescadillo-like [Procambarus clarkii]
MGSKRKKKGESGEVKKYITRNGAVRKLQLSLRDFRRICILKGIYPREPKNRKKVQKGNSQIKTLYYLKDIQFLLHEPIIWKFREHRAFMNKIRKAKARRDTEKADRLHGQKPIYKLDHIVQERYPTFVDALRDLDDPLTLCFLFSKMARTQRTHQSVSEMCHRLTIEFMHYVIEAHALRKVFISIKGYYYQVEIMGQTVTWIAPHPFTPQNATLVDLRIMRVFVEFYITLLGFVNFRLYHSLNLHYPPKLRDMVKSEVEEGEYGISDQVASLNAPLLRNKVEDNDEDEDGIDTHLLEDDDNQMQAAQEEELKRKQQQSLFKNFKFFLNRETNIESLTFVIRACQGEVSWEESLTDGSTYPVTDESITHQIVDRPHIERKYLSRYYIQPQWVYDCINARILLPVQDYFPGVTLPAHLSPFDIEKELYVPPEKEQLLARQKGDLPLEQPLTMEDSDDEDSEEDVKESEAVVLKPVKSKPIKGKKDNAKQKEKVDAKSEEKDESKSEEKDDGKPDEKDAANSEEKDAANSEEKDGVKEVKETATTELPRRRKKMAVRPGYPATVKKAVVEKQEKEEKRLAVMMIPRKQKKMYHILRRKEQRQAAKAARLTQKRKVIDDQNKDKKTKTVEKGHKKLAK